MLIFNYALVIFNKLKSITSAYIASRSAFKRRNNDQLTMQQTAMQGIKLSNGMLRAPIDRYNSDIFQSHNT